MITGVLSERGKRKQAEESAAQVLHQEGGARAAKHRAGDSELCHRITHTLSHSIVRQAVQFSIQVWKRGRAGQAISRGLRFHCHGIRSHHRPSMILLRASSAPYYL